MDKELIQQPEEEVLELGKIGYTAYLDNTGGISLATGSAIGMALVDALKRSAAKSGGKARIKLSGEFAALVEAEDPKPEQPTPEQLVPPVQKPSIGRIVIFHTALRPCPAIILGFGNTCGVNLAVFGYIGEVDTVYNIEQGDDAGQWSWPERVS